MPAPYLTKSKFTHCLDCPTKLYYLTTPEYPSTLDDNDFLQALAEGGLQVGELAKLYFPGGHEVPMLQDKEASLRQTNELLRQDEVTIFEAAIRHGSCFALVDVLEKQGNRINLIEAKSKSWDRDTSFTNARSDYIKKEWQPYLFDVAFQTWVARRALPDYQIEPYLMLIDKDRRADRDGLHQLFRIERQGGRSRIQVQQEVTAGDLGEPILRKVHVGELVEQILDGWGREPQHKLEAKGFEAWIQALCTHLQDNKKYPVSTGYQCKSCEYRLSPDALAEGQSSGFAECWHQDHGWSEADLAKPHVFDIWNERSMKKYLESEVYHMEELIPGMLKANPDRLYEQTAWDNRQRQTVQIMKATGYHSPDEAVLAGLFQEMDSWTYPLHFIDFEAVIPAIPFHRGQKPYRKIPFQFSCHTVYEGGNVEHRAEWIERRPGQFPCFDFARRLKACLEGDQGTVFMYHHFENTVLNDVITQLREQPPEDAAELITWLRTLTKEGERAMVDQQKLVVNHYYSPHMGGSNSIKDVLPAVLTESPRLAELYSRPYSGLSIKEKVLYEVDEQTGRAFSPYRQLDPIGHDLPDYETGEQYVADGGAAMMAWSRLQFDDVPALEREATLKALLQYCELDTLAMVMIHQHWEYLQ